MHFCILVLMHLAALSDLHKKQYVVLVLMYIVYIGTNVYNIVNK